MASKSFSIKESITYSWRVVWNQPTVIFYMLVATLGPQIISYLLKNIFSDASDVMHVIFRAVVAILSMVLSIGMVRIALNVYDKKVLKFENLYEDWRLIGRYLLAGLMNAVVVLVGFFLLILPGVYVALRLSLWPYVLIEKGKNSVDSLKESWTITKGVTVKLLGFYCVQVLLVLLGVMAFMIGLIVVLPVISIAQVYVYKKIVKK